MKFRGDVLNGHIIHFAINRKRADILRVLLETITDAEHFVLLEAKFGLRNYAKGLRSKRCVKVISEFEHGWMKKVAVVKKGYRFDCC